MDFVNRLKKKEEKNKFKKKTKQNKKRRRSVNIYCSFFFEYDHANDCLELIRNKSADNWEKETNYLNSYGIFKWTTNLWENKNGPLLVILFTFLSTHTHTRSLEQNELIEVRKENENQKKKHFSAVTGKDWLVSQIKPYDFFFGIAFA